MALQCLATPHRNLFMTDREADSTRKVRNISLGCTIKKPEVIDQLEDLEEFMFTQATSKKNMRTEGSFDRGRQKHRELISVAQHLRERQAKGMNKTFCLKSTEATQKTHQDSIMSAKRSILLSSKLSELELKKKLKLKSKSRNKVHFTIFDKQQNKPKSPRRIVLKRAKQKLQGKSVHKLSWNAPVSKQKSKEKLRKSGLGDEGHSKSKVQPKVSLFTTMPSECKSNQYEAFRKLKSYDFIGGYMSEMEIEQKFNEYVLRGEDVCKWPMLIVDEVYSRIKRKIRA